MRSADGRCLSESDIARLAEGRQLDGAGALHVERCPGCRERLESAREDAAFLGRARELASDTLGPEGAPRIPGYRTIAPLSSGSQGVVYRAVQESTARMVAIKVLSAGRTATPRQRARAEREAEIAARLRHPNIVTVFESRKLSDGRVAVIMEYVDGVPLDAWKAPGATAAERERNLLKVFSALCWGVHHAHLNGVIHRDLKPDNVLVTAEARPVVLDFGIAKAGGLRTTLTGEFAGTPAYASPEQASGRSEGVDALTDVYSLGVILYRLLCGAMPYEVTGSIFEIARTIESTAPVPPRERVPTLSQDLEAIVMRTLEKDKTRRYQSAVGLGRDIERYLVGDPVDARSGSGWYLLRKAVVVNRARLAWVGAAAVVLAGALVVAGVSLASAASSARRAAQQHEQAHIEGVRARAVTELLRDALPNAETVRPELAGIASEGLGRLYYRLETGAFADDPELDQALRRLWGGVYTGFGSGKAAGLVEYAEVSLRNGLTRLRLQHGAEHPDIAATMHELAGVLLVRNRAPEAEVICRQTLAMREKLLGAGSIQSAESRALHAKILVALGRTGDAEREASAALALLRSLPEQAADLSIASMSAVQARTRLLIGDVQGSEAPLREALVRRLRRLPPEDPDVLNSLRDLADLVERAPQSALAAEACTAWQSRIDAFAGDLRKDATLLGTPDRSSAWNLANSGRTRALGRLLRLQETLLGPDDPALVVVLVAQMRAAIWERELLVRAAAAQRAAELLAARFGPNDPSVVACLDDAAPALIAAGRAEEASVLARRACEIRYSVPEPARDGLFAANGRRRLAWSLAMAGHHDEAILEYRKALEELQAIVGSEHHVVALTQAGLALCLSETGKIEEAAGLSERAITTGERLPATALDQLAQIRFARGHVLQKMGRSREARQVLERAWEPFFRCAGREYPSRRVLIDDLAAACEAMNDTTAAARWRASAEDECTSATAGG